MKRCLFGLVLLASACGDEEESSTLRVSAWGEDFIEAGIPAEVFVDGWSVSFETFLVSLDAIEAGGTSMSGGHVVDLTAASSGQGHELGTVSAPAGGAAVASWSLTPATAEAITEVDAASLSAMVDAGASVWVRGSAQRAGVTKRFEWWFDTEVRYVACDTGLDRVADAVIDVVLTVHADHLFYDDLDSEEPAVAFDLIAAADADDDGSITMDELEAQSLAGQVRYQVGGRDIDDLRAFIDAQVRTLGHINGEGHCEIQ